MSDVRISDIALSLSAEQSYDLCMAARGTWWVREVRKGSSPAALQQLGLVEFDRGPEGGTFIAITARGQAVAAELVRVREENAARYREDCAKARAREEQGSAAA